MRYAFAAAALLLVLAGFLLPVAKREVPAEPAAPPSEPAQPTILPNTPISYRSPDELALLFGYRPRPAAVPEPAPAGKPPAPEATETQTQEEPFEPPALRYIGEATVNGRVQYFLMNQDTRRLIRLSRNETASGLCLLEADSSGLTLETETTEGRSFYVPKKAAH